MILRFLVLLFDIQVSRSVTCRSDGTGLYPHSYLNLFFSSSITSTISYMISGNFRLTLSQDTVWGVS